MSVLRESGSTRVSLPGIGTPISPSREFLDAVREVAAQEHFEVLGEMGHGKDLSIVYLARDLRDDKLVALRLEPGGGDEYVLDVLRQLDPSLPSVQTNCPRCGARPRGWGRFCTQCGLDLSGIATTMESSVDLLEAVKETAGDEFEILGEMRRTQGGGLVYFARRIANGELIALRLQREGGQDYSLDLTGVLTSLAGSLTEPAPRPPPKPQEVLSAPLQPIVQQVSRAPKLDRSAVTPTPGTSRWEPVIDLLGQPLFLGGLLLVVILFLTIVLVAILR